jgi:hypothetical protein
LPVCTIKIGGSALPRESKNKKNASNIEQQEPKIQRTSRHLLLFPQTRRRRLPNAEVFMPVAVVLAVGADSSPLASQRPVCQSAGCHISSAGSIAEAIVQLSDGDFDLILLDPSIPIDSWERLRLFLRASGSRIPVVCLTYSPGGHESFADATIRNEQDDLVQVIGELLAKRAKSLAAAQPCQAR